MGQLSMFEELNEYRTISTIGRNRKASTSPTQIRSATRSPLDSIRACPVDLCRRERPHEGGWGGGRGTARRRRSPWWGYGRRRSRGPRRKRASVFAGVGLRSEAPVRRTRSRLEIREARPQSMSGAVEAGPPAHLVLVHDGAGVPMGEPVLIRQPVRALFAAQEGGAGFEALEPLREGSSSDGRNARDQVLMRLRGVVQSQLAPPGGGLLYQSRLHHRSAPGNPQSASSR